ncbi:hypothetical protein Mal64_21800 [Pseudobythopirellula maris]|uniref:DUF1570 domain-containing protein n=1 Tax=Pseudobythopirellula maris TaxID=2527991 RepID=A0A5C5ZQW2_9BACT|nr:DUF1570 domain-containing protein [Pseudobythopirellula maris]TWT88693.1 hypothetical protein Mal64_21800 [Pseudobythopirellula maris]
MPSALLNPRITLALLAAAAIAPPVRAMEHVVFNDEGVQRSVTGRVLLGGLRGDMLLEGRAGGLWLIDSKDVVSGESDAEPFEPLSTEELGERLLADLPDRYRLHTTEHYVVAYDTSREYAEWTSSLLEGLQRAFLAYWRKQGFELEEPHYPLPIIIHQSYDDYRAAVQKDIGDGGEGVVGYYSMKNNRVTMFDITGSQELRGSGRRGSRREITRMLSTPRAVPLVATIVHEATHQIAYNCGLQERYSDLPMWLVEGMAVYFEAPDAGSTRGWRGIGKVNYRRLDTFRRHAHQWNLASLTSLVADGARLRDPRTAGVAYADAWALNYYLIKYRPDDYVAYMKTLSKKKALEQDTAETRLAEFREHFGDLGPLLNDFLRRMSRVD